MEPTGGQRDGAWRAVDDLESIAAPEVVEALAVDEAAARALCSFRLAVSDFGVEPGQAGADEAFEGVTVRVGWDSRDDACVALHCHPDAPASGQVVDVDD
ncbi:hypothetical protein ADL21_15005 [Streptomyces albus subsp. albus]|nr:hypothetical protein ADL21_15005 [Streptomyces albus subsp. albus]